MLLPTKHIRLSESIIGLASFVLVDLKFPKTIDSLWVDFRKSYTLRKYPSYHSFENLVVAVDFLYSIGAVNEDEYGRIIRCD